MICPYCKEEIKDGAVKCKHCGSSLDWSPAAAPSGTIHTGRNKLAAALFGILLGGLGIHKFYLGQIVWGIIYILFCWTFIPAIAGFIEGIVYLTMTDEAFAAKYDAPRPA